MKILLCVHNLTGGGAERVASLWGNIFWAQGHEVTVLTTDRHSTITYTLPYGIKHVDIGSPSQYRLMRALYARTLFYYQFRKAVKESKPDIIITVIPEWMKKVKISLWGLSFKLISTDHNSYERPESAPMSKHQWRTKFEDQKLADMVTVLTQADKDFIGSRLRKVCVLPNPLTFTPAESVPEKEKIVLAVGRLDAWHVKGFDLLIKAWGQIASQFPNWKLQIMGAGNMKSKELLMGMARKPIAQEQFEFVPYQKNPISVYQKADVFVLSSRYEGFGMVLIEAMSQGCACVACDYKGRQREIVTDGEDGLICETDNVSQLADKISVLIMDETLKRKIQSNAISSSKKFELNRISQRWNEIFSEL